VSGIFNGIVKFGLENMRTAMIDSELALFADKHHSHTRAGVEEDDPVVFRNPSYLIARALIHLETAFGFEALERGP
jgi:hypothetical protein